MSTPIKSTVVYTPEPGVNVYVTEKHKEWRVVSSEKNLDQTFILITTKAKNIFKKGSNDTNVFRCVDNISGKKYIFKADHENTLWTCRHVDRSPMYYEKDEETLKDRPIFEEFHFPNFDYQRV